MISDFFDFAKRQGFTVVLLLGIAWLLYNKIEHLETRVQSCEAEKFMILVENNKRSDAVIQSNTIAIERNTDALDLLLGNSGAIPIHAKKSLITGRGGPGGFNPDK